MAGTTTRHASTSGWRFAVEVAHRRPGGCEVFTGAASARVVPSDFVAG